MHFLALLVSLSIGHLAHADESDNKPEFLLAADIKERCDTTKEFITTIEYLREHKDLGLNEEKNRQVAVDVAKGCNQAAERFIKSLELLLKAEAGPRSSLEVATFLAQQSEDYTRTFITVFTHSYLAEYLDLDYRTSFNLARNLAVNYHGNPKVAERDFLKLVEFCIDEKNIGLSKPKCGIIAGRIVKETERLQVRMAEEFIKLYRFLTDDKNGPSSPIVNAIQIAEEVAIQGPEASDNFISSYLYGIKKDGLNLTAEQSINFAKNLAQNTWQNIQPDTKTPSTDRLPAGIGSD